MATKQPDLPHRPRRGPPRNLVLAASAIGLSVLIATPGPVAAAAETGSAAPSDSHPTDPVVRSDAELFARRATRWSEKTASLLLLDGDVAFRLGSYGFRARRAVVRIDAEANRPGRTRHLSIYFDQARPVSFGPGRGPIQAEAPRLLVTTSTTGRIMLDTNLLSRTEAPPDDELVREAADRVRRHKAALSRAAPTRPTQTDETERDRLAHAVTMDEPPATTTPGPEPARPAGQLAGPQPAPSPAPAIPQSVLPVHGVVSFRADRLYSEPSGEERVLLLMGNVRVLYGDREHGRQMSLTAERVVFFLAGPGAEGLAARQVDAETVRGLYLEDNVVAQDGRHTVRAPRMYFDPVQNKAILLNAVMFTWDAKRRVPLYVRADAVRQRSRTSFVARNALLTTSEFGEPHFAIAADRVTVDRATEADGEAAETFTARHMAFRVGGVPVFYWPFMAGQNHQIPLRRFKVGHSNQNGVEVESTWDLFGLAGRSPPPDVEMLGRVDYRGDHGPATGLIIEYDRPDMSGAFDSYLVPIDGGTDDIGGRRDIEQDNDTRGYIQWQHRHQLRDGWVLMVEAADISDKTFLEEFFPAEAYTARDYETSVYLLKQQDDWGISLLGRFDLTDFVPQLTTLQAPGYTVERASELGYYREGTNLWNNRLTWFSETTAGRMRLNFGSDTPSDRGFRGGDSLTVFGIGPAVRFDSAAAAAGLPEDEWVLRFDTRQELTAPTRVGSVDVTPYVVGRFTTYDDDFAALAGNDEEIRLWGMAGARVHTQVHRTYDQAESQALDVHGLRHIVEPQINVFSIGSNVNTGELPVFDTDVEGINEGSGVRLGVRNTLQTRRGGIGRWRSVDWIVLDTDVVLRSDDADLGTEIARFFDYRPEYSVGGDHFYTQLLWMVTDALGLSGELTYSFEDDGVVRWHLVGQMDHTPRLNTYVGYQEIDILDSRLLAYGFGYQLTTKYRIAFGHRLDFTANESRHIDVSLERRLPRWTLRLLLSMDEIDDETIIGASLIPHGFGRGHDSVFIHGP